MRENHTGACCIAIMMTMSFFLSFFRMTTRNTIYIKNHAHLKLQLHVNPEAHCPEVMHALPAGYENAGGGGGLFSDTAPSLADEAVAAPHLNPHVHTPLAQKPFDTHVSPSAPVPLVAQTPSLHQSPAHSWFAEHEAPFAALPPPPLKPAVTAPVVSVAGAHV